jgi:hypothetical protein
MHRKTLLTAKLLSVTIILFSQPLTASATDLTPSISFVASDYEEDATTWPRNAGSAVGSVVSSPMKKTTSGPAGVIFKGSAGSNDDRLAASIGPISETEVSVEMWLKLSDNGSIANNAGSFDNNSGSMLFSWGQEGGFTYNVYHYKNWIGLNTFNGELLGLNATALLGKWTHFIFVMKDPIIDRNFSSSNLTGQKIYVNGALVTLTGLTLPGLASSHRDKIGFDPNGKFLLMDNSYDRPSTWNAKGVLGLARVYKGEVGVSQASSLFSTSQSAYVEEPPLAFPAFTLSSSTETANAASAILGYTVNSTGGAIASYSISPSIGNGLSFSKSTGLITGTPASQASVVTYTVTATNVTGSSTATFTLTVNPDPAIAEAEAEAARLAAIAEAARLAAIAEAARLATIAEAARLATIAEAARQATAAAAAKQQRELTEILSIIPSLGALALSLGETTKSLTLQKCVKKKQVRYVKKGVKCPKGFVKKK